LATQGHKYSLFPYHSNLILLPLLYDFLPTNSSILILKTLASFVNVSNVGFLFDPDSTLKEQYIPLREKFKGFVGEDSLLPITIGIYGTDKGRFTILRLVGDLPESAVFFLDVAKNHLHFWLMVFRYRKNSGGERILLDVNSILLTYQ